MLPHHGRNQLNIDADTPTGTYEIGDVINLGSWSDSLGDSIVGLKGLSGKAKASGRSGISIHAGREATSKSAWDKAYRKQYPNRKGLRATKGCIRASIKDMKNISKILKDVQSRRNSFGYRFTAELFRNLGLKVDKKDTLNVRDK